MKKLNNRGFSLVELIVTFTLVSIMMFLVLELTVNVRHSYNLTGLKTEFLTKQSMVLSIVNDDLNIKKVSEINDCGENCFQIVFYDTTTKLLVIDKVNNVIRYGNEAIELGENAVINDVTTINTSFAVEPTSSIDSYVILTIPITNDNFPEEDFTIRLMYQYHSVNFPLSFGVADPGDPGDPGGPADLTAYNAALAAVTQSDYTIASWSTYDAVVQANVVTEENTQGEVDAAEANIIAAQASLVLKADLTDYNIALNAVDEGDWTPASWSTYMTVVNNNVVTEENTQAEVDAAEANIIAAQANLEPFIDLAATMSVSTVSISSTVQGGVRTHTIQVTVTNGHGSVSIGSWVFTIGPGAMSNFNVTNPIGCNIQTSGANYIISNGAGNGTIAPGTSITFNMSAQAHRNDDWAPSLTNFGATE